LTQGPPGSNRPGASALDSLTEENITNTVRQISARASQITILRVVESGAHAALLDRKGLYYAMWRQQIGERPTAHAAIV
jgi:ATP-binding cassette subfamily B protein